MTKEDGKHGWLMIPAILVLCVGGGILASSKHQSRAVLDISAGDATVRESILPPAECARTAVIINDLFRGTSYETEIKATCRSLVRPPAEGSNGVG